MTGSGILIAHDFSERSERAARRAFQLAREHGRTLNVVHVVDEMFAERKWLQDESDGGVSVVERLRDAVSQRLKREFEGLERDYRVRIRPHAAFGYVAEQLHSLVEKTASDMLVIGAHGRHAVRDLLLGATAEQLLWYMTVPTLVVRSDVSGSYRRIVIAADFSEEAETAMACVRRWFPGADVRIVHVIDNRALERLRDAGMPNEALDREWQEQDRAVTEYLSGMMERTGLMGDKVEVRIVHGHPVEEIENHIRDFDAGLLVMGGHSRSRLTRWLPGRVASRLIHQVPCDVMLARGE